MRPGPIHNDGIDSIKASNRDEVSRLNQAGIVLVDIVLGFSDSQVISHQLKEELDICLLHVVWNMRSIDWIVGVSA